MYLNYFEYITFDKPLYLKSIFLQFIELLVIGYMILKKRKEFKRVKEYFENLTSNNTFANKQPSDLQVKQSIKKKISH
jgi:hypothetical protein